MRASAKVKKKTSEEVFPIRTRMIKVKLIPFCIELPCIRG
jgi:hypothetical protein